MGDQVELQQQQQTRVLLINGQTIILQGDVTDNSINEINTEILEQAIQEATNNNATEDNQSSVSLEQHDNLPSHSTTNTSTNVIEESHQNEGNLEASDDANNFVAIFENENGETQTVQLTLEQAAALGFQVDQNTSGKEETNEESTLGEVKDNTQFSDSQSNESIGRLQQIPTTVTAPQIMIPPRSTQHQPSSTILGSLLKPPPSPSTISLVPHYVGNAGSMSYAIKLQESDSVVTSNSGLSELTTISPQNTNNITSHTYTKPQTVSIATQPTSSSPQNQKLTLPSANKNVGVVRQQQRSIVKLKSPLTSTILRTTGSKTVIPKIQGTPTSMANLSLSTALPISSTASMVRVLNNPVASTSTSLQSSTTSKLVSSTAITSTPMKTVDKNSVPKAATNSAKPLGSSENPIQLVQHGQTFHSMQPLSQEQLKQIATVLQQKQLDTSRNSKNVLFDSTTNTRIIYRVVYPEDLALKKPSTSSTSSTIVNLKGLGRGQGRKGRPPKSMSKPFHGKKINSDEEDEQLMDPDLSKGEKEERKKVLPRTRSGRLSRPPRHMVKDYKRIHHLDFAEPDLDDSDGGYSDYRISDSEAVPESALEDMNVNNETINTSNISTEIPEGGVQIKRAIHSKFRCPTCQKMYLGNRRLARHFEAFPDHGSMDNIPKAPLPAPKIEVSGQSENLDNMNGAGVLRTGVVNSRGRGRRRGNPLFMNPVERAERRKAKLREFLNSYEPSLVAEIAGPLVAQTLGVWQLMLLRVASSEEEHTRLAALLAEMSVLLDTARSNMSEILHPVTGTTGLAEQVHTLEVNDDVVASALNISCGTYTILESDDRKLQWRPASIVASACSTQESQPPNLNLTTSSNTESEEPAAKKARLWHENEEETREENPEDKNFLDTTNESEKPSDTSICSDTPLDDIVKAELKNLANKSGLDDFVAPPPAPPLPQSTTSTSDNVSSHTTEVDFVATPFPNTEASANSSHFTSDIVMDIPTTNVSQTTSQVSTDSTPTTSSSVPSKHSDSNIHFQLSSSSRLDLSEGSIDVNLDSHLEETTHTIDFEAFSEEFNANTQS